MSILLLGGNGFIGRHLRPELSKLGLLLMPPKQELNLLDRPAVFRYFAAHAVTRVVYSVNQPAIAGTLADEQHAMNQNLRMLINVADAAERDPVRSFMFLGSGAEYSKAEGLTLVREGNWGQNIPQDAYGFGKFLSWSYLQRKPYPTTNLRCFGVYGPGESAWRFPSEAVQAALQGQAIVIRQDVRYEYTWIEDLVAIVTYLIRTPLISVGAFNVGTGQPITLLEMAELIWRTLGTTSYTLVNHPGMRPEYTCNSQRLTQLMAGRVPVTSHAVAIDKLIQHFSKGLENGCHAQSGAASAATGA